jgi:hypothetical protein
MLNRVPRRRLNLSFYQRSERVSREVNRLGVVAGLPRGSVVSLPRDVAYGDVGDQYAESGSGKGW